MPEQEVRPRRLCRVPVHPRGAVGSVQLEHAWKYAGVRIDTWMWVARLTKTRGLAAEALKAGRVTVDGGVAKPSREVRVGDRIEIRVAAERRTFVVRGLAPRRGPATEAALLYDETPESLGAREEHAAQRRATRPELDDVGGRPTKRDRRRFERARGRG